MLEDLHASYQGRIVLLVIYKLCLCLTVPMNTAREWADEVIKFCRGELMSTTKSSRFSKRKHLEKLFSNNSDSSFNNISFGFEIFELDVK